MNCGTILGQTSTVSLNGGSTDIQVQSLSGSGTYSLNSLLINNTFSNSPKVQLNKDVNVAGALTLSSGVVYTSSTNILALGTAASSSSGSSSSFVSGPMSKAGSTNFVFPVGKGTSWRRAGISSLSASATFRAEYFNSSHSTPLAVNSPIVDVSRIEYWQVDLISGSANANLSLYWENATASGIDNCSDLTIARFNGSSWDERAATAVGGSTCTGTGTGTITTTAVVTAFSPFTFGSKSSTLNPLPVELVSFTADCQPTGVALGWVTASERNSAYFAVEKSDNGDVWTELSRLPCAGNSKISRQYSYTDANAAGDSYYRLRQVDFGGATKVSKPLSARCEAKEGSMRLYPNPSTGLFNIDVNLSQDAEAYVIIINTLGQVCHRQQLQACKGACTLQVNQQLPPGLYTVQLVSPGLNVVPGKLLVR
jgi:hypothetical protein